MDCSLPGFPVLYYLLEFAQTHVHSVSDPIQPFYPLSPPSPPALSLFWHNYLHGGKKALHMPVLHIGNIFKPLNPNIL